MSENKQAATPAAGRGTLTPRTISRKLLARKAAATAGDIAEAGDALEDAFPAAATSNDAAAAAAKPGDDAIAGVIAGSNARDPADPAPAGDAAAASDAPPTAPSEQPASTSSAPAPARPAQPPRPAPAWSGEDERALQAMLARRRAAGYQRRGRDVSGQIVRVGDIAPNPDTVVATIVGLVRQAGGSIRRGALLDAMAAAAFAHPKARPGDRGWCQAYIGGTLRDGFLAAGGDEAGGGAGDVPCDGARAVAVIA